MTFDQPFLTVIFRYNSGRFAAIIQTRHLWHDFKNFLDRLLWQGIQGKFPCIQALARGAFGKDHLMIVKQQMEIFHFGNFLIHADPRQCRQLDRGNQYPVLAEHPLHHRRRHQHPVLP